MPTMQFELNVELEGGETYTVTADQRDIARFEMEKFGYSISVAEERGSMLLWRFLAWNASYRTGRTTSKWTDFDQVLVEAMPVEDEADDEPDPTNPDLPA